MLSTDTGFDVHSRPDHYANYSESGRIAFPISDLSNAIHPNSVVYGFDIEESAVAFSEDFLQKNRKHAYDLDGRPVAVSFANDGVVRLTVHESGESFAPIRLFWFAWFTFYPETDLVN